MQLNELVEEHRKAGLSIIRDVKSQPPITEESADELMKATRHFMAAWVLVEATE